MHDVSNAINILDPSNNTDKAICNGKYTKTTDTSSAVPDENGKCQGVRNDSGSNETAKYVSLSHMFEKPSGVSNSYPIYTVDGEKEKKVGNHTSATISKDVAALTRERHGVVSSAFAKAHEGAEIVEIRSISTTSVMVNACYDVLTEGLPVSPYACAGHHEGNLSASSGNNAIRSRYTSMMYISKKNMHDVSNAINILDPKKNIDKKICKVGANDGSWSSITALVALMLQESVRRRVVVWVENLQHQD